MQFSDLPWAGHRTLCPLPLHVYWREGELQIDLFRRNGERAPQVSCRSGVTFLQRNNSFWFQCWCPPSPSSPKELKSQGVKCFDWSSRRFGKDHRVFPRLLWGSYSAGISMVLWLAWDQVYKVGPFYPPKRSSVVFLSEGLAERALTNTDPWRS